MPLERCCIGARCYVLELGRIVVRRRRKYLRVVEKVTELTESLYPLSVTIDIPELDLRGYLPASQQSSPGQQ
jgi:hypothetical protein